MGRTMGIADAPIPEQPKTWWERMKATIEYWYPSVIMGLTLAVEIAALIVAIVAIL